MGKLIVLRGLPGSGKKQYIEEQSLYYWDIYSSDYIGFNKNWEQIKFCPKKNKENDVLLNFIKKEEYYVVLNNLNLKNEEFLFYVRMALAFGHKAEIIEFQSSINDCLISNLHNLSKKELEYMKKEFEPTIEEFKKITKKYQKKGDYYVELEPV